MNIYTFYVKIDDSTHDHQLKLIDIWKKSWSYYGWNPVIYGLKECQECEGYDEYYKICDCTETPQVMPLLTLYIKI